MLQQKLRGNIIINNYYVNYTRFSLSTSLKDNIYGES